MVSAMVDRTWRIDESISSLMDRQTGIQDSINSASIHIENDHMPRTTTCAYDPIQKVVLSNTIWEKDESKIMKSRLFP